MSTSKNVETCTAESIDARRFFAMTLRMFDIGSIVSSSAEGALGAEGVEPVRACTAGAAGAARPAVSITAMRVPTSTVSPSATSSSRTVPDAGAGTSVSTLSVEISTIVSSAFTASPTCLRQVTTVPSDTLTPICGMTTSTSVPVLTGFSQRSVGVQLVDGGQDVVDLRDEARLQRSRERHGRVRRGEPHDGSVEVLEDLLADRRRDLGAESRGARVLVQDERLAGPRDGGEHGLAVPRDDGAQVDDLGRDSVLLGGPLGG